MQYKQTQKVSPRVGMSQEEALDSLQSHPEFKDGTKITSVRKRGERWVIKLLEPVTAADDEPVVPFDGSDDGPPTDKSEKSEDEETDKPDKPEPPKPDNPVGEDKPKSEDEGEDEDKEVDVLSELLDVMKDVKKGLENAGVLKPDIDESPLGEPETPEVEHGPPHAPAPPKPEGKPEGPGPEGPPSKGPKPPKPKGPEIPTFSAETKANVPISVAKRTLEEQFAPYKVKKINRRGNVLKAEMADFETVR